MTRVRCTERTPAQITGTLTDTDGDPVTALVLCEVTIWDVEQSQPGESPQLHIINDRDAADITSDVTMSDTGAFTWTTSADDNALQNPRRQIERHRVTLHCEWTSTGSPQLPGEANLEFELEVLNLGGVR